MHAIEPYYSWRNHYISSNDPQSPFYERQYNEMSYHMKLYDHFIHPQWDGFGSSTLYLKILFVDYEDGCAILEFIGEWNDCLHNDIMLLKRDVIEPLQDAGVTKFILIGENVLNFHYSDDSYYEEWFDEVTDEDGWVALLNFNEHVLEDMKTIDLDSYFVMGGELNDLGWRTYAPDQLFYRIQDCVEHRIGLIG
ncbi:MAG TPA: hypothetical protein EYN67_12585 [Flavobacteriales bacterium]|jgi:hypothetical protein|nr:hypothetical protein [Flavobacteriales bacterium]HIB76199.1 hypothetical protein [Flavobacteriales bacterium]HIN42149.1 hypothetical protein [Flavobacteriales bacterium]HIO15743.1 hypothetical protein [Flavobacteriales bacterium]